MLLRWLLRFLGNKAVVFWPLLLSFQLIYFFISCPSGRFWPARYIFAFTIHHMVLKSSIYPDLWQSWKSNRRGRCIYHKRFCAFAGANKCRITNMNLQVSSAQPCLRELRKFRAIFLPGQNVVISRSCQDWNIWSKRTPRWRSIRSPRKRYAGGHHVSVPALTKHFAGILKALDNIRGEIAPKLIASVCVLPHHNTAVQRFLRLTILVLFQGISILNQAEIDKFLVELDGTKDKSL